LKYFPLFFDLTGQKVLVVGGGEVALRKISLLERSGASISVVAPDIAPELMARAAAGKLKLFIREFSPDDLQGARLVIVATSQRALNRWVASLSDSRGIPVNVVDDARASRFIVPAIIDRDPVLVAVSTGGDSPVLARRLRERLEALIPARIGELATWLKTLRETSRRKLRDTGERRRFFEAIVDGAAARRFIAGDSRGATGIARRLLATTSAAPRADGEVILVGAGPGDPELLTLKALRALQDADVILHDRLVPAAVLDLARRDAARICVGKAAGNIGSTQQEINALLIEHASRGKRVVRLKGGDPFVFGRGGEELQALAAARINFSVVPGITAALGAAAYAGIPLTHRDHAQSVSFVTGHSLEPGKEPDWRALAMSGATAVFYMGLARLDHIVERLLEHGAADTRPAAIVAQGTTPDQRVIAATLATIRGLAAGANLQPPALLIVGEVAALHSSLAWFNSYSPADLSQSA
jgi:uroporphyrin-III C-methyltransferase / precorrin-2 dehydrogenase / sirohydrochlorin ferrochelatase